MTRVQDAPTVAACQWWYRDNVGSTRFVRSTSKSQTASFSQEQAQRFVKATSTHRLAGFFAVVLGIGLRRGEALGLRWQDVDLERGTVQVRQTLQQFGGDWQKRQPLLARRRELLERDRAINRVLKAASAGATELDALRGERRTLREAIVQVRVALRERLQFVEPKSEASTRLIILPATVREALQSHRRRQLEERLAAGAAWKDSGLVFTTPVGGPSDPRNVTRAFKVQARAAGLPTTMRLHDCRHSCATLLLPQGVQPRMVQELLGHADIKTTLGTYCHVLQQARHEAAGAMDAILSGA